MTRAAVDPSVSPSGFALHPALPLASTKCWGPSPSLGNLSGTWYPHSRWTGPFYLPSTALPGAGMLPLDQGPLVGPRLSALLL